MDSTRLASQVGSEDFRRAQAKDLMNQYNQQAQVGWAQGLADVANQAVGNKQQQISNVLGGIGNVIGTGMNIAGGFHNMFGGR